MATLREWLGSKGLGRYAAAFEKTAIDGERRQLTVMSCDLVGSTELAHGRDPEDLRNLIRAFREVCKSAITRFEGFLAQYSGDEVMAYFAYPQAHGEDAERAVRAGLGIIEGLSTLNAAAAEREGICLRVRIGIATGPVVVGDVTSDGAAHDGAAIGETPNLASRLQKLAQPDSVVISDETRRLALDHFDYCDLGDRQIKGLSRPVRVWQVLGARETETRFEARSSSAAIPFVGRAEELALVLRLWDQVENGEGQVVFLSGEAGIGKSRLAQALRERLAQRPHSLVRYQCSPFHRHSSLYPVTEHIRRAARFGAADDAPTRIEKVAAWLRDTFNDVKAVTPLYTALLSIDTAGRTPLGPEALKSATVKALAAHVGALAAKRPVLLILEDAQWIDPTTEEMLDALLPDIAVQRVLVVITYRTDYRPRWSGLAHATTLPLARLPRRDAFLMAAKVCGKPLSQDLLDLIVDETDGVPLFIEEMTKAVLESDLIVETQDSYRLNETRVGPGIRLEIPMALRDPLMARLDRTASMREVAQFGSCIGRQFSRELLAAVRPLDEQALGDALRQLEDAGLLLRSGTPGDISYTFKHTLVRDAAYDSLLKSKRKRIHARIAKELRKSDDVVASAPETLALHYTAAKDSVQAAAFWRLAAEHAGARYANDEAIAHCRNGLAAVSDLPHGSERAQLELALRISLATWLRITDRYSEALAELATAEELATEHGRQLELSRIHHLRANICYPLGRIDDCFEEHEAALRCAERAGSLEDKARALGGLGDAHFLAGRIRQAHEHFEECVALSRSKQLVPTEVAYLPMRAVTHMYCLRYGQALEDCRSVMELVASVGRARGELISRSTSSWILLDRREPTPAGEQARRGLEAVEEIGARRFIPLFNDAIARIRLDTDDREGALALLDESWAVSWKTGVAFVGPVVLGAIALATSDAGRRIDALRRGEAILHAGCASHNFFRFYRDAIEVSLREQQWDMADSYADALARYLGDEPAPWPYFFVARGRALAAVGRQGRREPVVAQLQKLHDQAKQVGLLAALPSLKQALGTA